ncbi:MAG: hypothetical protein ABJC39_09155 [Chloroflexota bacterium]
MDGSSGSWLLACAAAGVVAGLFLLARGLAGYRSVIRVGDTGTSPIGSLAAGEVRVSGVIESAELTLISLLQSVPCVYYRAMIGNEGNARTADAGYTDERSIGFRVRDATGSVRVFPRGASFDAPVRFEGETSLTGDEPAGLAIRLGGSTQTREVDAEAAARRLLTVREPDDVTQRPGLRDRRGRRSYREWRLEPGDVVTVVGRALPFADLADPAAADLGAATDVPMDDPEVAADIARARASGALAGDPAAAWGNAAIAGFGIGRPVVEPAIDPAADRLPLADVEQAARADRTFRIAPEALVLAASDEVPLLIAHGVPGAVVARGRDRFMVGLLGAVLAIVSAMVFAVSVGDGSGS